MKLKTITIALLLFATAFAHAQTILKGTVEEAGKGTRLNNVFIKDLNNRLLTLTDDKGNFQIAAATGHTLVFNSPGYANDTLYVIDMQPKTIKLEQLTIALREVSINGKRSEFNPQAEYPEVYEKSKVYVLSPSSWFGKEGKDARRLKRYFAIETQQEKIDEVFNTAYVGSLVPLKGQDLENFMTLYRPSYAFIKSNNGPSLAVYINDSYKKYLALPPSQRSLQQLSN
jgi:ribosomal protein S11